MKKYYKYVRCRYCDSSIGVKDLTIRPIEKENGISHDRVYWTCPACGYSNKSFIFNLKDETDKMEEIEKYKEALPLAGKVALSSEAVIKSNIFTLSDNLRQLNIDLNHYNKYIFEWSLKWKTR